MENKIHTSIKQNKTALYDKEKEIKDWLYKNVDHWTWISTSIHSFRSTYRNRVPSSKVKELDNLFKQYDEILAVVDSRLSDFVNKKSLKDFTKADLEEVISYADMSKATGWKTTLTNAEENPSEWLLRDTSGENIIKQFKNERDANSFAIAHNLELINPIGEERIFFRKGSPPESGRSYNSMTNTYEEGVSVYVTPKSGSLAGDVDRKVFYGKGRQIDTGGDDEPVIIITGKWNVFNEKNIENIQDNIDKVKEMPITPKTMTKLEEIHESRSPRAKVIDEAQTAQLVITKESDVQKWVDRPNRYDIEGIDTKKISSRKIIVTGTGKAKKGKKGKGKSKSSHTSPAKLTKM